MGFHPPFSPCPDLPPPAPKTPGAGEGKRLLAATGAAGALPLAPRQWEWRGIASCTSRQPSSEPPPRGRLKFFDGVSPVPLATSPGVARAVDPPHGGLKWGGGGPQPPPPHAAVAQWPHREEPRHGRVLQEVKGAPVGELHWGEQEATGPQEKLWGLGLQPALIGGLVISEPPSPLVVRATGGE